MNVQSILTAPKNGSVILTDEGFARWGLGGWLACDPMGDYIVNDYGLIRCSPSMWTNAADWP